MKTFQYKGFRVSGQACAGLVEALDTKEARERLAQQGILAEKITAAGSTLRSRLQLRRRAHTLHTEARAEVYRELGVLLESGLPLVESLDVLIQAPEAGMRRTLLAAVRDAVREGQSLGQSMSAPEYKLTSFEAALLEAGEKTGALETILDQLASFLEEQHRVEERAQTALIYPCLVFALAIAIAVLVMGVMIPAVGKVLAEARVELPLLTRFLLGAGEVARFVTLPILGLLGVGGYLVIKKTRESPEYAVKLDRFRFRIPVLGRLYRTLVNLRFAKTLVLLLRGGVQLVDCVALAGRATGSPWVQGLAHQEAESMRHGQPLAEVITHIPPLSGSLASWAQAGEASGNLVRVMESAGHRFQQQWEKSVTRALNLLEPLVIIAVGAFVLMIALAILLPILSLNQAVL